MALTRIVRAVLTSGTDAVTHNSRATASISPTANRLVLLVVGNRRATAAAADTPTVSGGGMTTWTQVGTVAYAASSRRRVTVYRAMQAVPGSGTITIATTNNDESVTWAVLEYGGVETSGANGVAALRTPVTGSGTSNAPTVTLAALASAKAAIFFAVGNSGSTSAPDAGWTEQVDISVLANNFLAVDDASPTADNTPSATLTATPDWGALGVELVPGYGPAYNALGTGSATNATVLSTGALAPTADRLLLAEVYNRIDDVVAPPFPELSGPGATPTQAWDMVGSFSGGGVSTPPVYRGKTEAVGNTNAGVTVAVPAGTVNGDAMVLWVWGSRDSQTPPTINTPAGWTLRGTTTRTAGSPGRAISGAMFTRVASSEPANYTATFATGGSNQRAALAVMMTVGGAAFDHATVGVQSEFVNPPSTTTHYEVDVMASSGLASGWAAYSAATVDLVSAHAADVVTSNITTDVTEFDQNATTASIISQESGSQIVNDPGDYRYVADGPTRFPFGGDPVSYPIAAIGVALKTSSGSLVNERLSVFRAISDGSTGVLSATFGGLQMAEARITVVEYDTVPATNNGADAVEQAVFGDGSVTLLPWQVGSAGYAAGRDPSFADVGWTEVSRSGDSFDAYKPLQDLTVSDSGLTLVAALEVLAAGLVQPDALVHDVNLDLTLSVVTLFHNLSVPVIRHDVELDIVMSVARVPIVVPARGPLGQGLGKAWLAERGGRVIAELRGAQVKFPYTLDNVGQGSLTVPLGDASTACCEALSILQPGQHEIIVTRDDEEVFVGAPSWPSFNKTTATIEMRDLGWWLDVRKVALSRRLADDVARIAQLLIEDTLAVENSMLLEVAAEMSGNGAERAYDAADGRYVGEEVRDLARVGMHWTVIRRAILIRSLTSTAPVATLLNAHVDDPGITPQGIGFGTEFTFSGKTRGVQAIIGGKDPELGLIQVSVNDLRSTDGAAVQNAAQSAHDSSRRPPIQVTCQLLPNAPVDFKDLVPASSFNLALEVGCREAVGAFQLQKLDVAYDATGEKVSATFTNEREVG